MGTAIIQEALRIPVAGNVLAAELAYPADGEPETAVLLLAPHPHMGGRMDNNVIRHVARRAAEDGCATLRFDYHGVGESTFEKPPCTSLYEHWEAMEREQRYEELLPDSRGALAALLQAVGPVPRRAIVGYSLGAILAGMVGRDCDVTHLVAVSPPVARVSLGALRDCPLPKLFLGGDGDFAFDLERFEQEFAQVAEPRRFVRLEGSDHFFRQEEERLYQTLAPFLLGQVSR